MPIVSVIVPVFNVEKYIRRCLESIKKQTLSDIEIIVVNDGTPDNSMDIVHELAKDDKRISILNHEKNMGLMWTRRTGYMAATGNYISFCDSDDYLPSNALEILYGKAIKTNADIVSGNYFYITSDGNEHIGSNNLVYGNSPNEVYKSLLQNKFQHCLWGKIYKNSLFQKYTYETFKNVTNGEDGALFYQVLRNANFVVQINHPVYYYVQNSMSSTQRRYNENAIRSICILNKIRVQVISAYPELKKDLNKCVTNILCMLYAQGYHRDANLRKYINEFGLSTWISLRYILNYLNYIQYIKVFSKRCLLSFIQK